MSCEQQDLEFLPCLEEVYTSPEVLERAQYRLMRDGHDVHCVLAWSIPKQRNLCNIAIERSGLYVSEEARAVLDEDCTEDTDDEDKIIKTARQARKRFIYELELQGTSKKTKLKSLRARETLSDEEQEEMHHLEHTIPLSTVQLERELDVWTRIVYVKIHVPFAALCKTAEDLKLLMPLRHQPSPSQSALKEARSSRLGIFSQLRKRMNARVGPTPSNEGSGDGSDAEGNEGENPEDSACSSRPKGSWLSLFWQRSNLLKERTELAAEFSVAAAAAFKNFTRPAEFFSPSQRLRLTRQILLDTPFSPAMVNNLINEKLYDDEEGVDEEIQQEADKRLRTSKRGSKKSSTVGQDAQSAQTGKAIVSADASSNEKRHVSVDIEKGRGRVGDTLPTSALPLASSDEGDTAESTLTEIELTEQEAREFRSRGILLLLNSKAYTAAFALHEHVNNSSLASYYTEDIAEDEEEDGDIDNSSSHHAVIPISPSPTTALTSTDNASSSTTSFNIAKGSTQRQANRSVKVSGRNVHSVVNDINSNGNGFSVEESDSKRLLRASTVPSHAHNPKPSRKRSQRSQRWHSRRWTHKDGRTRASRRKRPSNGLIALSTSDPEWSRMVEESEGAGRHSKLWIRLSEYWVKWKNWRTPQPLEMIRAYFGEKISFYFAWLDFYTRWLIFPSALGIAIFFIGFGLLQGRTDVEEYCSSNLTMCAVCESCDKWNISDGCSAYKYSYLFDNYATVLFALLMSLWATIFIEFWKRQQNRLAFKWNVSNFEEMEPVRPQFEFSSTVIDDVTGLPRPFYPSKKRIRRYVVSFATIAIMLVIVIMSLVGIIVSRAVLRSLFYESNSQAVSNSSGAITSVVSATISLVVILLFNKIYQRIALKLTRWENHEKESSFERALIIKVFLFEVVNNFSSIFYVAFFKGRLNGIPGNYNTIFGERQDACPEYGCLIELTIQLSVIMVGKQFIGNVKELMLPLLSSWFKKWLVFRNIKDIAIVRKEKQGSVDLSAEGVTINDPQNHPQTQPEDGTVVSANNHGESSQAEVRESEDDGWDTDTSTSGGKGKVPPRVGDAATTEEGGALLVTAKKKKKPSDLTAVVPLSSPMSGAEALGEAIPLSKLLPWTVQYPLIRYPGVMHEYLELILQFGFTTLFVAAFPLAPLFAFVNNIFEIRLDARKHLYVYARTFGMSGENIGIWLEILNWLGVIAVITNAFVIAVTSNFIPRFVYTELHGSLTGFVAASHSLSPAMTGNPNQIGCYYAGYYDADGTPSRFYFQIMMARFGFVLLFEHVVFSLKYLLGLAIYDLPADVETLMKRQQFQVQRALRKELDQTALQKQKSK